MNKAPLVAVALISLLGACSSADKDSGSDAAAVTSPVTAAVVLAPGGEGGASATVSPRGRDSATSRAAGPSRAAVQSSGSPSSKTRSTPGVRSRTGMASAGS